MRRPVKNGAARLAFWWVLTELSSIIEEMKRNGQPGEQRRVVARLDRVMIVVKALRKLVESRR